MGELEEKLSAILENPQAMSQIMSLAQSLGGGSAASSGTPPTPSPQDSVTPAHSAAPDLTALPESQRAAIGGLDPRLMQLAIRVMQEARSDDDRRTALLQALRPFVKEQRYAKIDRAIQIAKLSRLIRVALDTFKGGSTDHV